MKISLALGASIALLGIGYILGALGEQGIGCAQQGITWSSLSPSFRDCSNPWLYNLIFRFLPAGMLLFVGGYYEYKQARSGSRIFIYLILATIIIIALLFFFIFRDYKNTFSALQR